MTTPALFGITAVVVAAALFAVILPCVRVYPDIRPRTLRGRLRYLMFAAAGLAAALVITTVAHHWPH